MSNLQIEIKGRVLPHGAFIGSGPPGNNATTMRKAIKAGWNIVTKTYCLHPEGVVTNTSKQLARWTEGGEVLGMQNIQLISTEPATTWYEYIHQLKDEFPDSYIIASVMAGNSRDQWDEIIKQSLSAGADGIEANVSCPHGLPAVGMGSAIGENVEILERVSGWITTATPADKLCLVKATPNVTDIRPLARAALRGGVDGISAINTVTGLMVDQYSLTPMPAVGGCGTYGGISGAMIRPMAHAAVAKIATVMGDEFPSGRVLSAIGGICTGYDAAVFFGLGADFFQVCTAVMQRGYGLLPGLLEELQESMESLGFSSIDQLRGFTLRQICDQQSQLVELEQNVRRRSSSTRPVTPVLDSEWTDVVDDTDAITDDK